jgi:hypothetical protein
LFNTVANKENLKLITTENDFYHLSQVSKLIEKLLSDGSNKVKYHQEDNSKNIIHYWWVLLIILLFPFLEWLIRKNNGLI